jgi:hypothetical protein
MDMISPYAAGSSLLANDIGVDPSIDTITYCAEVKDSTGSCKHMMRRHSVEQMECAPRRDGRGGLEELRILACR